MPSKNLVKRNITFTKKRRSSTKQKKSRSGSNSLTSRSRLKTPRSGSASRKSRSGSIGRSGSASRKSRSGSIGRSGSAAKSLSKKSNGENIEFSRLGAKVKYNRSGSTSGRKIRTSRSGSSVTASRKKSASTQLTRRKSKLREMKEAEEEKLGDEIYEEQKVEEDLPKLNIPRSKAREIESPDEIARRQREKLESLQERRVDNKLSLKPLAGELITDEIDQYFANVLSQIK